MTVLQNFALEKNDIYWPKRWWYWNFVCSAEEACIHLQIPWYNTTILWFCSSTMYDFQKAIEWFNQSLLRPDLLESYGEAIYRKGSALNNVWGLIDGTTRPCARPWRDQRLVYNGHKRHHCLKYQSITSPNGIIANLFGPLEVRCHDSFMLAHSGVMVQLEQHSFDSQGNSLCINSDAGYLCGDIYKHLFLETLHNNKNISVKLWVKWEFLLHSCLVT